MASHLQGTRCTHHCSSFGPENESMMTFQCGKIPIGSSKSLPNCDKISCKLWFCLGVRCKIYWCFIPGIQDECCIVVKVSQSNTQYSFLSIFHHWDLSDYNNWFFLIISGKFYDQSTVRNFSHKANYKAKLIEEVCSKIMSYIQYSFNVYVIFVSISMMLLRYWLPSLQLVPPTVWKYSTRTSGMN